MEKLKNYKLKNYKKFKTVYKKWIKNYKIR